MDNENEQGESQDQGEGTGQANEAGASDPKATGPQSADGTGTAQDPHDQGANRARVEEAAREAKDAADPAIPAAGKIDTHAADEPLPGRRTLSQIIQDKHDTGTVPQIHGQELALFSLKVKELQTAARSLVGKAGDDFDELLFALIRSL